MSRTVEATDDSSDSRKHGIDPTDNASRDALFSTRRLLPAKRCMLEITY